jgi:hypothetical protein
MLFNDSISTAEITYHQIGQEDYYEWLASKDPKASGHGVCQGPIPAVIGKTME